MNASSNAAVVVLGVAAAAAAAAAQRATFERELPSTLASVDALGIVEEARLFERWHTVCSSEASLTEAQLAEQAALHQAKWNKAREEGRIVRVNRSGPSSGASGGGFSTRTSGLDVIFEVALDAPVGDPISAFELAEAVIESRWNDNATLVIPVTWDSIGTNILGLASITRARISYASSRTALIAANDADDYAQSWLPTGSSLPVRMTYNSAATTNVSQIDWPVANYLVAVGTIAASPGSIRFSADSNWDENPSDGITPGRVSLVDVIVHEFGHIQGFDSNAEVANAATITSMDMFRFASIDRAGLADTAPDSQTDFTATPREVDGASGGTDLVHFVIGDARHLMSDGSVNQASHLKQVNFDPVLASGIMQPIIAQGRTFAPAYFREPDMQLLDAIGWKRIAPVYPKTNGCNTDWNKDGWPDIVWRARSTTAQQSGGGAGGGATCISDPGQVVSWTIKAGQLSGWQLRPHPVGATLTCPPNSGPPWTLVLATTDVDGDCDADIIWRSPQGAHVLWRMESGVLSSWSVLPSVDENWSIVAGGDVDANGTGDLLWRNRVSNELGVWYMLAGNVVRWQSLGVQAAPPWEVQGLGNVLTAAMSNGNDGADILWRNTSTGANRATTITNAGIGATVNLPAVSGSWRIKGAGDYNGDGTTDLFWFNSGNGTTGIWFMDGTVVQQWQGMPALNAALWE